MAIFGKLWKIYQNLEFKVSCGNKKGSCGKISTTEKEVVENQKGSCGKSERKLWKVQICVSCGKNRRKLWKNQMEVVEKIEESCGKSERKLWKVQICVSCGKNQGKLWKIRKKVVENQKGSCGKNKKEVVERFLETKSKSWKAINRGKPPRILKINKKANRGTALKGGGNIMLTPW